eukprot:scaffold66477_cov52-Phaeocystis_antarctica.AAC.1
MGGKRHGLHERDSFRIGHDARQRDGAGVSGRHRLAGGALRVHDRTCFLSSFFVRTLRRAWG